MGSPYLEKMAFVRGTAGNGFYHLRETGQVALFEAILDTTLDEVEM